MATHKPLFVERPEGMLCLNANRGKVTALKMERLIKDDATLNPHALHAVQALGNTARGMFFPGGAILDQLEIPSPCWVVWDKKSRFCQIYGDRLNTAESIPLALHDVWQHWQRA